MFPFCFLGIVGNRFNPSLSLIINYAQFFYQRP